MCHCLITSAAVAFYPVLCAATQMADGSILQATKYPNVEEVCIGEFVLRLEPHAAQLYVSQPEPAPGFPRQRDTFMYPTSAGENITVYVWDTGAMVEHEVKSTS